MKKLAVALLFIVSLCRCSSKIEPDFTDDFVGVWRKENVMISMPTEYLSIEQSFNITKIDNKNVKLFVIITRKYNYILNTIGLIKNTQIMSYDVSVPLSNGDNLSFSKNLLVQVTSSAGNSTEVIPVSASIIRGNSTLKLRTNIKVNTWDLGGEYDLVK
ncbi:MAG: hypothetical protein U0X91_03540 [Spirosomataceae bacterium]